MRSAKRVMDVTRSEISAADQPSLKVLVDAGVRAVISTPLTSGSGGLLGMISVHFMKPHRPAERELGLMDLLARQTADYLERSECKSGYRGAPSALARANRQLTGSSWSGVDLTDIARLELEPFGDRSTIHGINIILDAPHAQNFTLALHELATSATKYAALWNESDRVMVSWTVTSEDRNNRLNFKWQETGGPPVAVVRHSPPKFLLVQRLSAVIC